MHHCVVVSTAALELLDIPDNISDSSSTQNSVTSSSITDPAFREPPRTPVNAAAVVARDVRQIYLKIQRMVFVRSGEVCHGETVLASCVFACTLNL